MELCLDALLPYKLLKRERGTQRGHHTGTDPQRQRAKGEERKRVTERKGGRGGGMGREHKKRRGGKGKERDAGEKLKRDRTRLITSALLTTERTKRGPATQTERGEEKGGRERQLRAQHLIPHG